MWHGALHAERDAVDTGGAEHAQRVLGDRLRVRLCGDLDVVSEPERLGQSLHHERLVLRRQQRRRPTAEEHRRQRGRMRDDMARQLDLGQKRADVLLLRGALQLTCGVGVEVAVAATGGTERHVDVGPEGTVADSSHRVIGQPSVGRYRFPLGQGARHRVSLSPSSGATWGRDRRHGGRRFRASGEPSRTTTQLDRGRGVRWEGWPVTGDDPGRLEGKDALA